MNLDIKIIRKVQIPTIEEEDLKTLIIEALAQRLPKDVVINDIEFNIKRSPQRVLADVNAQFANVSEPEESVGMSVTETKTVKEVEPEELTATDAPLNRDGTLDVDAVAESFEEKELDLIDEVLAETADDDEAPFDTEDEPKKTTVADLLDI